MKDTQGAVGGRRLCKWLHLCGREYLWALEEEQNGVVQNALSARGSPENGRIDPGVTTVTILPRGSGSHILGVLRVPMGGSWHKTTLVPRCQRPLM